ncbi:hypothetical protein CF326_g5105 [Tilletia indica]|nr:hypothetical protein CF326_g5105 [Tilletia indica]
MGTLPLTTNALSITTLPPTSTAAVEPQKPGSTRSTAAPMQHTCQFSASTTLYLMNFPPLSSTNPSAFNYLPSTPPFLRRTTATKRRDPL